MFNGYSVQRLQLSFSMSLHRTKLPTSPHHMLIGMTKVIEPLIPSFDYSDRVCNDGADRENETIVIILENALGLRTVS
jgi:hypothetical protein